MDNNEQVDWEKVNRGKVRYGFALELYKRDKSLAPSELGRIEAFVDYVMDGVEDDKPTEIIKEELLVVASEDTLMTSDECKEVLSSAHEGTDSFIRAMVHMDAKGLKREALDNVLNALKTGKINMGNLQASLDKIHQIKQTYK